MTDADNNATREATRTLDLREVLATVNSLALTNTLVVLITGARYSQVITLAHLRGGEICFAFVLLVNIIRFYHGNMGIFRGVDGRAPLASDFVVIFLQTVIFSVTSFYVYSHADFIALFIVLLALDTAWLYWIRRSEAAADALGVWVGNNLVAIVLMSGLYLYAQLGSSASLALYAALTILAGNTLYDLIKTRAFYFPGGRPTPSVTA
jgi:hypothetical protein